MGLEYADIFFHATEKTMGQNENVFGELILQKGKNHFIGVCQKKQNLLAY